MIIVYVIDSYGEFSNGTTITAKRSKEHLEKLGYTVRVVSTAESTEEGFYQLKKRRIPLVSYFAEKQSMNFAKPDKKVFKEAFKGASLVHVFLPYKSGRVAIKVARQMKIPVSSAFHMQPEHITYGMGLDRFGRPLAWFIYKWLKWRFYRKVAHIHCPSEFIRDQLIKHNYKNVFHVISNGVEERFFTTPDRNDKKDLIKILTIGRYSKEKRQDTLLKAINKSKYKDNIKVILAGKGPRERHLKKLAKKYRLNCQFSFFSQEELIKKIEKSVLYIHPAEAEIEGISALEAIASGLVPIVAKSKQSATQKFTLTEESLFKVRDYQELAQKIDYFIDFYERRKHLEAKYRNYLRNYQIEKSISLLEEFFKETIYDYKRRQAAHSKQGKRIKKSIVKTRKGRAASFLFYYFFAMPVLMFYFILIRGLRIKGKKNLKKIKNGAIFISNHVHKLDSAMGGLAAFPKKPIFTSLPSNFQIPIVGSLVHILGASPIPATPLETKIFFTELKDKLVKGRYVHFFPEGELITKSEEIREFKRGAFMLAEEAKVPIVPLRINFIEKERRIHYPFFMKDKIELLVGKPIYPNIFLPKRAAIDELQTRAIAAMQQLQ